MIKRVSCFFAFFCCLSLGQQNFVLPIMATTVQSETVYQSEEEAIRAETVALKEANREPGSYQITIAYHEDQKTVRKKITVTVKGPHTVVQDNEVIDANDITMNLSDYAKITDEMLITLAKARAWNKKDNMAILITKVDVGNVQAKAGAYDITFATANQTATTVTLELIEDQQQELITKTAMENRVFFFMALLLIIVLLFPFILFLLQYRKLRKMAEDLVHIVFDK